MAIPSVRAVGTVAASTGAISPGIPAGTLAGDILVLFIGTRAQTVTVSGGTETWTEASNSPITRGPSGTGVRLTVFWARASQDSPTGPTTNDSGNMQQGRMIAFSGCLGTGDPFNTSNSLGNFGQIPFPSMTTTVNDCLVIFAGVTDRPDVDSTTEFSSFTYVGLSSVTEQIDNTTSQGLGGGLAAGTGGCATAAVLGGGTCVAAAGDSDNVSWGGALLPAIPNQSTGLLVFF